MPAPPLWQPFLFKGYLPQDLPGYRGREREEGLRSELGKLASTLPPASGREGTRSTGRPPSSQPPRLCSHVPQATPRPRQASAARGPLPHPLAYRRHGLGEGASDSCFQENANLLQTTCARGCWEGMSWPAPPQGEVGVHGGLSSPTPFSARAPFLGHRS